jgi:hypothetical protein
VETEIIMVEI